jgi:serine/threonine-protein kinase
LEARREGLWYRIKKFVSRNRRPALAASLTVALVAGLVVFFTLRLARERDRALAEAARTRQIQSFMLTLFGSGDHEAAPSKDLRVLALLDRGVRQSATLGSDPETQAYLYESLGRMYRLLGNYRQADEMLRLALERMKSAVGSEDIKNVDFMLQLGALRGDEGQTKEALRMVQDGLNLASRHLPPDDTTVVSAKSALGRVLFQSGAYDKAIAVLEPLTKIPPMGREGSDNLLETLEALGVANLGGGNYERASEFIRRALSLDRQIYGDSHPRVADDLANLGTIAVTLGRNSEAEERYREAAGILQAWYGPDHPETLQVMSFVALLQIQQNKFAEAEPVLQQVLKAQEATYGRDHSSVSLTLDALGRIARGRGRLSEARAYFSRALKITEVSFGESSTQAGIIKSNLGDVFAEEGQYHRAEQFFREALAAYAGRPFKGNVSVGVIEVSLGRALLRQKKFREAEKPLAAGYEILMAQPTAYAVRLEHAREDLLTVYALLHEPEKAAALRAESAVSKSAARASTR